MVFSIERHAPLAALARRTLDSVGATSVVIHVGDGTEGLPQSAPFDRILVTAGAPSVPDSLQAQLAPGGRLVIPVGPPGFQHLTTVDRRDEDAFDRREFEPCIFVPLIGRYGMAGLGLARQCIYVVIRDTCPLVDAATVLCII